MGTTSLVKITIQSRDPKGAVSLEYQEEYQNARRVFEKFECTDCIDATDYLVDCGKWHWADCMSDACASTKGLVFSVHCVSSYREARIEYYLSGFGFAYSEKLMPKFDEKLAKKAIKIVAQQEELRKRALQKLSPEERSALGIKAA